MESASRRDFVFMSRRVAAYSFGKLSAVLQKKWAVERDSESFREQENLCPYE